MSAIITLAMVEEACHQGAFQVSLDKACNDNGFPNFKFNLSHEAAVMVVQILSANHAPLKNTPKSNPQIKTASHLVKYRSTSQTVPVGSTILHHSSQ